METPGKKHVAEPNVTNETGEAKLNMTHMGCVTIKIKQELTSTETRSKTY